MDASVTIAMFPDARAAGAAVERLRHMGIEECCIAQIRGVRVDDRDAAAALVVSSDRPPVVIEGFLVRALFAALDADPRGASLVHGSLRRMAVPERGALAYEQAIHRGAALVALRTPAAQIERTCRAFEAAGACAPTVHHFPDTRNRVVRWSEE